MGVHERQAERIVDAVFAWAARPEGLTVLCVDRAAREAILELAPRLDEMLPDPPLCLVVPLPSGSEVAWRFGVLCVAAQYGALRDDWSSRGTTLPPIDPEIVRTLESRPPLELFAGIVRAIASGIGGRSIAIVLAPSLATEGPSPADIEALVRAPRLRDVSFLWLTASLPPPNGPRIEHDLRVDHEEARAELVRRLRAAAECPTSPRARGGAGPARPLPLFRAPAPGAPGTFPADASRRLAAASAAVIEGRWADAAREQALAATAFESSGEAGFARELRIALAGMVASAGEPERGIELASRLMLEARGEAHAQHEVMAALARAGLVLCHGPRPRALSLYREAAERARALGELDHALDAVRVIAELELASGHLSEAATALRTGIAWCDPGASEGRRLRGVEIAKRIADVCRQHGLSRESASYASLAAQWASPNGEAR